MTGATAGPGRQAVGRILGLDVLRGVAVGLVMIRHAWPDQFGGSGIVGVVMFFALSGYLITGVLCGDLVKHGRIRYPRFYRNRALRLLPALLALVTVFTIVEAVWNPLRDRALLWHTAVIALTYTMDVPGHWIVSDALGHLWTLATEEQFYLLWPLLLAFAIRRGAVRSVAWAAAAGCLLLCLASVVIAEPRVYRVYDWPTCWSACLLIGALARLSETRLRTLLAGGHGLRTGTTALAAVLLTAACLVPEPKNWSVTYLVGAPIVAACAVVFILRADGWATSVPVVARPLLGLGVVSYAAYLWNYPVVNWMGPQPLSAAKALASIVLTVVAATASWWLVERPVARYRARLDSRRTTTTAAESPAVAERAR
jgi:peptidoglycan/LPS O-acetylase OafA/YrhL